MANPALSESQFSKLEIVSNDTVMTINGTINKTIISLSILMIAGYFTFTNPALHMLIWPGFILGFIVAMITIFKERVEPYLDEYPLVSNSIISIFIFLEL